MSGQYSGEVCVADDGLINPTNFPCKSSTLDTSLITGSGDQVAALGTSVLTTTESAETAWKGLQSPGVFETPDSGVVYTLLQPAVTGATNMKGVTGRVSTALHTYASELDGIKPDLEDLEQRAKEFRTRALQGYEVSNWEAHGLGFIVNLENPTDKTHISWKEHGPAVEKNESLLGEYNAILERISTAATTCANAIQSELTMMCVAPAEVITADMLAASDISTWGTADGEDRNCTESVGHGLGNFWHNTWTGAASLIGRDATTGEWSWETAGKTWWGVGDFALSTVIVLVPGVNIAAAVLSGQDSELGNFMNDRYNTAVSSWGGLIGWDQQAHLAGENGWHKYEEDGIAALTESVANVGTFFIPVAGAASGGTKAVLAGTRVGSFVVKAGTHLAEFVIPAGSYLVKGTVKVIDLGVDLTKGGWRGLVDALTPGPVRPNALPGITGVATEAPHVPLPSKTPVSSSLGLEGAPPVHTGGQAPGASGSGAPHGGIDGSPLPEHPGGEPKLGNQWGDQQPVDPAPTEPHPTDPHPADPNPADPHPGADGTGDHTGSGLDSDTRDRIIEMEKGSRPLPETYLSPDYIREHLQKFDGGATRFMTESNLSKYGIGQADGTAFVMPTAEVDALLRSVNGDMRKFEAALGLPDGFFDTNKVVRVDIANPAHEGLRMPSGNEAGANSQWLPGGKLPTGISEAVIDIPSNGSLKYDVQPMGGHAGQGSSATHLGVNEHAPGSLSVEDRVRIQSELPDSLRNDPQHDPTHPRYDSLSHDSHGNIGTVNPDVPSESGLTNSGRLIDPDVIPEQLRPYLEAEPPAIVLRDGVLYLADRVEVTFNRKMAHHDLVEFVRQVDLQEQAMRQLSASDWGANIDRFEAEGRLDTQVKYREEWLSSRTRALEAQGMTPELAHSTAKTELEGLVGLHGPDQFPGGNPNQLTGFGDSGVNSSLGAQWGSGLARKLREQLEAILEDSGIPAELLGDVRLNIELKVNDVFGGAPKVPRSSSVTTVPVAN